MINQAAIWDIHLFAKDLSGEVVVLSASATLRVPTALREKGGARDSAPLATSNIKIAGEFVY